MSYLIQLPNTIKSLAISLDELGITDLAWKWGDVQHVIEFLKQNDFAILGGDVYIIENNQINTTYDSWYINRGPGESWYDYINECEKKTIEYINEYHFKNGDNYCYSLVYNKEVGSFN
ncbi:Imm40 family immunity protein [Margalitia sp. FSL K6-0131]|uniref:Imm40 family immunity protein n=1 Tax=Margalitia sp. FSL K6-0131 TaxID=2954604 RepID=UPI0030F763C7